jgi:CelD/BcsL family acetyltransferase involved in cellulose biosynthesis
LVAGLSGSFRSTLRRKVRAGEQAGLTTEMRRDAAALDEAFDVAREGWAHRQGTGIGSTPATRRFYRALAGRAERRGWLRIALLRDGGEAIGFEFNLMRGRDAYNLKLGYRDSRADLSPGVVLRARVMEAMIGEGARSFDLLGSAEAYKLHWTDRVVPHVRLRAFPPTVAGRFAHLCRQRLRPAARDILNRLRGSADERG